MAVLRAKTRTKLFFRQNRPCRCVSRGFSPPVGERHLRENRTEPFAMICALIEAQICKKWPFSAIFRASFIYKIIHRDFTTGDFRAIRRRVINIYKCYQPVLSTPQAWPWKTLSNIYIIIYNLPKPSVLSVLSKSKIDIVFEGFCPPFSKTINIRQLHGISLYLNRANSIIYDIYIKYLGDSERGFYPHLCPALLYNTFVK